VKKLLCLNSYDKSRKESSRKRKSVGQEVCQESCQQEGLSRFRDVKGKPDQEKVATSEKGVERKDMSSRKSSKN
jgi:hypothetical protein